jgi:hypothetical protein
VFRGFRATPATRGRVEYQFMWLLKRPMRAVFDTRRGVLAFPALFPGAGGEPTMALELKALVAGRTRRDQPAHKRIDARRARLASAVRQGDWSLAVEIRGANHEYAVRHALNLVNELFLVLHASYPDYLVEHFGMSTE